MFLTYINLSLFIVRKKKIKAFFLLIFLRNVNSINQVPKVAVNDIKKNSSRQKAINNHELIIIHFIY